MPAVSSVVTIVALGKFDPDIFRLDSLVESKVISEAERQRSEVMALLPNRVAHFKLPWGDLLVLNDRMQLMATEAPFIRAADLVAQAMNMAGDRCSIRAFGVNLESHFDLGSMKARDVLATKFAPPEAWGEWGRTVRQSMESAQPELHGGMTVLTMRELFRAGDIRGWYDVTLTPSEKVPNNAGVKFITNHHHDYVPESPPPANASTKVEVDVKKQTDELLKALAAVFDDSIGKGELIFAGVLP